MESKKNGLKSQKRSWVIVKRWGESGGNGKMSAKITKFNLWDKKAPRNLMYGVY